MTVVRGFPCPLLAPVSGRRIGAISRTAFFRLVEKDFAGPKRADFLKGVIDRVHQAELFLGLCVAARGQQRFKKEQLCFGPLPGCPVCVDGFRFQEVDLLLSESFKLDFGYGCYSTDC